MTSYTHNGDTYRAKTEHLAVFAASPDILTTETAFNANADATKRAISIEVHKADNRGQTVTDEGSSSFVEISSQSLTTQTELSLVWAILSLGGECFNLDAWFEIDAANYNDQVPVGVPNRSYIDENGNEVVRTWAEWKSPTYQHHGPWDGKYYVPGSAWLERIKGSEFFAGQMATGVGVITLPEFLAIQAANAPQTGE